MPALLLVALLVLGAAPSARTDEARARIFATGLLAEAPTGERLIYSHRRSGVDEQDGAVILTLMAAGQERSVKVELRYDQQTRTAFVQPVAAGHPLLLTFLESVVRSMAAATGGSPYYIRNRMREALGRTLEAEAVTVDPGGEKAEATRFVLEPFARDPNRARMGPFADLQLSITLAEAVPGEFVQLAARAAGYDESMTFDSMEAPE